jgi:hypothetical protein
VKLRAIGLGLLLTCAALFADGQNPGAVFLEIWPGARPTALGGSFAATADDASATFYNQGGLAFVSRNYATLMHSNWLPGLYPGMYYEFAGFTHEFKGKGTMGVNVIYLTTGKTEVTNSDGQSLGEYTTFDMASTVAYGFPISDKLGVGIGVKFIYSFLVPNWVWALLPELGITSGGTGTTWAADAGVLYKPWNSLWLGAALSNLGPNIAYTSSGEADPLPRMLRLGIRYTPVDTRLFRLSFTPEIQKVLVGMFYNQDQNNPTPFADQLWYELWEAWKSFGIEASYANFLTGRVGYFEDITGQRGGIVVDQGGTTSHIALADFLFKKNQGTFKSLGLTYGGGLEFKRFAFDISFDGMIYDFPTSNLKFSFSYQF